MEFLNTLLDQCRDCRNLDSDSALADALHVTRAAVSHWRRGHNLPDAATTERIALLCGHEPAALMAMVEAARARSDANRRAWQRVARKLGAAATVAAVALFNPSPATATAGLDRPNDALCALKSVAVAIMRWLARSGNGHPAALLPA